MRRPIFELVATAILAAGFIAAPVHAESSGEGGKAVKEKEDTEEQEAREQKEEDEALPTRPIVESIRFEGNDALSGRKIRAHILTQATSWPRFWVTFPFHEDELAGDMDRIAALYRLEGYYQAEAEYSFTADETHEAVAIEIHIEEGKPVRTERLRIRLKGGERPSTHARIDAKSWEDFLDSLSLERGEIFELDDYREARDGIRSYCAERGLPEARLTGGAEVDLESHRVVVNWTLDPGRHVRLGEVNVSGMKDVDEKILRREIRLKPGQSYSTSALAKTRRRLQNLGLFRWTVVESGRPEESDAETSRNDADPGDAPAGTGLATESSEQQNEKPSEAGPDKDPREQDDPSRGNPNRELEPTSETEMQKADSAETTTWPVDVRVAERPPRSVRVGGGWGTDTSFRAELSWHHRNFFGGARRADVALRYSGLGGAFRPTFTEPYFLGTRTRLLVSTAYVLDNQKAYTARRILTDVQFERELIEHWTVRFGYRFDRDDVFSVEDEVPGDDDLPEGIAINTGPHMGLRRTTVDNLLNARTGTLLDLTAESSVTVFGSDEDFIRYVADARSFFELWTTVVASRVLLATIHNLGNTKADDIPLVERFYAGGSSSMRGFGFRKLGPEDINGDSIGGSSLIESSVEWRIPIFKKLGVVGFVDAAFLGPNAWRWELDEIRYAAGPGLRYETPAGPIRVDFAWRLNPKDRRGKFRVSASLGHTF